MLLGVDTGGTFTDFVLLDANGMRVHKVLSTPDAPERAILQGVADLGLGDAIAAERLRIVHGSTVATNAALERKGVRTAYIGNAGLEDLLTLARQNRATLYDLTPEPVQPPVPPELCLGFEARLDARGQVLKEPDSEEIAQIVRQLASLDARAVAINLLYSWLDDRHERELEAAIRSALPDRFVSRSSFVLPEYREYERGMATWLNAWLGPLVERYLLQLEAALAPAPLAIMQSSGGTIAAAQASQRAVNLLLSGPAGGIAGARFAAAAAGLDALLSFDMGGTSTDVALIGGDPQLTSEGRIGPWPVAVPMLDIHTIGAGGGSIARRDGGGALQVGPESAGADPGPACYGRGGTLPTVTDANVHLGRLPADVASLGGSLRIDRAAASAAITDLAQSLGLDTDATAAGILRIANENMTQALRVISVERGIDPRQLTLCCFGGAGGLHLCELAERLDMDRAVVPRNAGVLSAFGMLVAEPERALTHTVRRTLAAMQPEELIDALAGLEQQARTELGSEGHAASDLAVAHYADLRYAGQSSHLTVALIPAALQQEGFTPLATRFAEAHEARFGHTLDADVECVNVRVRAHAPGARVDLEPQTEQASDAPRDVAVVDIAASVPVHARGALTPDTHLLGPAIITEATSTTWLAPGWTLRVDPAGNLMLRRREERPTAV